MPQRFPLQLSLLTEEAKNIIRDRLVKGIERLPHQFWPDEVLVSLVEDDSLNPMVISAAAFYEAPLRAGSAVFAFL